MVVAEMPVCVVLSFNIPVSVKYPKIVVRKNGCCVE